MAAVEQRLEISVGQNVRPGKADVVFAPTDEAGTPGNLNSYVCKEVGLPVSSLRDLESQLERGFAVARAPSGQLVALVVTIGDGRADDLLGRNLTAILLHETVVGLGSSAWMPLMGTGSGGLSPEVSLRVSLEAIAKVASTGRLQWQRIQLSLPRSVRQDTVGRIWSEVEKSFASGPFRVSLAMETPTDRGESRKVEEQPVPSEGPQRIFDDDLPTQVDAPQSEPKLGFGEMADAIVAVVEDTISVDTRFDPSGFDRTQEWLSAADARLTVGIFAPWGAGKSTLINALRRRFNAVGYPVFAVNPWKWDGKGDLHDHVRATVIDQAQRQGHVPLLLMWLRIRTVWRSWRTTFWILAVVVATLIAFRHSIGVLLNHDPSTAGGKDLLAVLADKASLGWLAPLIVAAMPPLLKIVSSWLTRRVEAKLSGSIQSKLGADGLSVIYRDIASLIYRGRKFRPFVFVFDDLDRCTPERVAAVLDSVHSLTASGCIVLIACDDEYVVAAVNAHYEKVAKMYGDFGRRYLDKIVQISFRLPLLKNADIFELGLARATAPAAGRPVPGTGSAPAVHTGDQAAAEPGAATDAAQKPAEVDKARLQEIIGDLLGCTVEPLGLNIRQAKSIANTLKLYLRIERCRTETEARRLAAFVFADRFDQRWLDGLYHEVQVPESPLGTISDVGDRLAEMIGKDRTVLLRMYHLLGRRPRPASDLAAPRAAFAPTPSAAAAAE